MMNKHESYWTLQWLNVYIDWVRNDVPQPVYETIYTNMNIAKSFHF